MVGINIGYSVDELTSKLRLHSKKINYVVFNQTGIKAGDYDKLNDSSEIVLVVQRYFTTINSVNEIVELTSNLRKPIIGGIVI